MGFLSAEFRVMGVSGQVCSVGAFIFPGFWVFLGFYRSFKQAA